MSRTIILVQAVQIASPCTAKWDDMAGDDCSRFCSHCNLNVYNLSAMTEEEGERLIIEKEGKLCARIYRRYDGTVLTKDCPVGLRAIRKRMVWLGMRAAAALACIISGAAYAIAAKTEDRRDWDDMVPSRVAAIRTQSPYSRTIETVHRWLTVAPPVQRGRWTSGTPALMNPQPPPPSGTTVPNPLSATDIDSMTKDAARSALSAIVRFERYVQDESLRDRLKSERQLLLERLRRRD